MPDLLASPGAQTGGWISTEVTEHVPYQEVRLVDLCHGGRFGRLDRLESYYRGTQHDHKQFSWEGMIFGFGQEADIQPGWYVPYRLRRPCARYQLGRVMVRRITSMMFGTDRFPELKIENDPDAEDFAKTLATESRLPSRMIEARNEGGAEGAVGISFKFVGGRPRTEVHKAKHCTVLRWADESEWRPAAVLKTYCYPRRIWNKDTKRMEEVMIYHARYWDELREIVWKPIPQQLAETTSWWRVPRQEVVHGFGFIPFYWVQNTPNSQDPDADADYEAVTDDLDELDQILSATSTGTKANVDPTLVIKEDPIKNPGALKKGTGNTIWAEGGADYLELSGQATKAGMEMAKEVKSAILDVCGVVMPDEEKLSGAAQSAQAMRILYAPMLAACDVRREQYGEHGIKAVIVGMMRAAKQLASRPPMDTDQATPEGAPVLLQSLVLLPPRMVKQEDGSVKAEPRKPGESEDLVLNWNPYFPPTWTDISAATTAANMANGQKPVASQKTTIQALQSMWGVNDVDAELDRINEEADEAAARQQEMFAQAAATSEPATGTEAEPPVERGEDEE